MNLAIAMMVVGFILMVTATSMRTGAIRRPTTSRARTWSVRLLVTGIVVYVAGAITFWLHLWKL